MTIEVNGSPAEVGEDATVASVIESLELGGRERGVAVAVDAEVVPRSQWAGHVLSAGARVEVLAAVQGG